MSMFYVQGQCGVGNYIALMKHYFITNGCGNGNFCPYDGLLMEQIATFLVRAALHQAGDCEVGHPQYSGCSQTVRHGYPADSGNPQGFSYPATPYFWDVPSTSVYFPYIQKLRELEIWFGCGGGAFCPTSQVNRVQMAEMVIRALIAKGKLLSQFYFPPDPFFTDIGPAHPQFSFVQKMRQEGIVSGVTATTFGPSEPLSRYAAAVFMTRAFFTP